MQEVFEKIIEELKSEAKMWEDSGTEYKDKCEIAVGRGLRNAIEIVKQEAEKFGRETNVSTNGWIPCSELLPAYGQTVLASVCAEDAEWKIIIACYKEEDFWLDGKIDAWQPLPQPFQNGE